MLFNITLHTHALNIFHSEVYNGSSPIIMPISLFNCTNVLTVKSYSYLIPHNRVVIMLFSIVLSEQSSTTLLTTMNNVVKKTVLQNVINNHCNRQFVFIGVKDLQNHQS